MKLFYTIGEVAEMLGVNTSLLRYYESEFRQLRPAKGSNGTRSYKEKDIELLRQILYLTRDCGYTLDGAREQLRRKNNQDNQTLAVIKLRQARQQLVALRDSLQEEE